MRELEVLEQVMELLKIIKSKVDVIDKDNLRWINRWINEIELISEDIIKASNYLFILDFLKKQIVKLEQIEEIIKSFTDDSNDFNLTIRRKKWLR